MKNNFEQRKSEVFIKILEFDAPKFYDFDNNNNSNLEEIDEWFKLDHSKEAMPEPIALQQKFTYVNKSSSQNDEEKTKEEETKLDELIKLHNEKIRKRKVYFL